MWRFPEHAEEISRASASGARRRGSAPCSCTRSTSATSRRRTDDLRQEPSRRCARPSTRPARSRRTASSSTSARTSAPASKPGSSAPCPALREVLDRCSDTTWLLLENSAGAGGTIGRSIDELAILFDALDRHPRLGICLDSCHLYVSGRRRRRPGRRGGGRSPTSTTRIGLDRLRALHVNDAEAPLGSNRDRHANVLEGELGERIGVFLAHPAVQEPPGGAGDPGPGRPRPRRGRAAEAARPARPLDGGRSGSSARVICRTQACVLLDDLAFACRSLRTVGERARRSGATLAAMAAESRRDVQPRARLDRGVSGPCRCSRARARTSSRIHVVAGLRSQPKLRSGSLPDQAPRRSRPAGTPRRFEARRTEQAILSTPARRGGRLEKAHEGPPQDDCAGRRLITTSDHEARCEIEVRLCRTTQARARARGSRAR